MAVLIRADPFGGTTTALLNPISFDFFFLDRVIWHRTEKERAEK
jgi:hypothetical protein